MDTMTKPQIAAAFNPTPKHEKLLRLAATPQGAPDSIYIDEARELCRAGLLVAQERFSKAGGNRLTRLFLAEVAQ